MTYLEIWRKGLRHIVAGEDDLPIIMCAERKRPDGPRYEWCEKAATHVSSSRSDPSFYCADHAVAHADARPFVWPDDILLYVAYARTCASRVLFFKPVKKWGMTPAPTPEGKAYREALELIAGPEEWDIPPMLCDSTDWGRCNQVATHRSWRYGTLACSEHSTALDDAILLRWPVDAGIYVRATRRLARAAITKGEALKPE